MVKAQKKLLNTGTKAPLYPAEKVEKLLKLQAQMKKIKPQIEDLKADLLKTLQDLDVFNLKTGKYTITRAKRITPRVEDFELLKKSLKAAKIPFGTKEVFEDYMKETFKVMIEEGKILPGLDALETEYALALPAKKKEAKHGK